MKRRDHLDIVVHLSHLAAECFIICQQQQHRIEERINNLPTTHPPTHPGSPQAMGSSLSGSRKRRRSIKDRACRAYCISSSASDKLYDRTSIESSIILPTLRPLASSILKATVRWVQQDTPSSPLLAASFPYSYPQSRTENSLLQHFSWLLFIVSSPSDPTRPSDLIAPTPYATVSVGGGWIDGVGLLRRSLLLLVVVRRRVPRRCLLSYIQISQASFALVAIDIGS